MKYERTLNTILLNINMNNNNFFRVYCVQIVLSVYHVKLSNQFSYQTSLIWTVLLFPVYRDKINQITMTKAQTQNRRPCSHVITFGVVLQ